MGHPREAEPQASFVFVPAGEVLAVARATGGYSFDAPGADYTHRAAPPGTSVDEWCPFEVLLAEHHLDRDPGLVELARIVHAADIARDLHTHPAGPGLLAIGTGGLDVESDDHQLLERGLFVYEALYAWCRRQTKKGQIAS